MILVSPSVLVSATCFISAYLWLGPFYRTSKQRAWIMTGLSSTLTSLAALPYFYDFILSGGRVEGLRPTTVWSDTVVGVFQGYLIADLLAGSVFYREHISLMTGWVHHTLYFALLQYVSTVGWSNIFCLALIMEVPTMLLALGSLHPRLRNDYLFAGVFFATRIVLHVVLILAYFFIYLNKSGSGLGFHEPEPFRPTAPQRGTLNATEVHSIGSPKPLDSPLPTLFFLAALPMHVMWLTACIKGILRRRSKAVTASQKPDMPIVLVSPFRARLQTIRGRLALDQEARERLRVRVQAAYGQARERVWRRQAWTRRTVGVDGPQAVET